MIPVLFGILTGEVVEPDTAGLVSSAPALEGAAPSERASTDQLVYAALAELPPDSVIEHLAVVATGEATSDVRLLAAKVLTVTAGPGALDTLFEIVSGLDPLHLEAQYLRGGFSAAIAAVLRAEPREFTDLAARLQAYDLGIALLVVESLPPELVREGLAFVLAGFERDPGLDLVLMEELGELAGSPRAAADQWTRLECLQVARRQLKSKQWQMRSRAIMALAELHDVESLELFVKALDDEHRTVQRMAHLSLGRLTGQRMGPDREQWLTWIDAERKWFEGPRGELEWDLLSGEGADMITAIRELIQHPLYRDSSSELLASLLDQAEPGVFASIHSALLQLGSVRAAPYLVPLLAAAEEQQRTRNWQTLCKLTGLELPPEPNAWERELGL